MSWHQAEARLVMSPDSTMQLVQCPDCPSPGLVQAQEMSQHISLHHRGQGFRCAVCQFSGVTVECFTFQMIRNHLIEVHRVTEESSIPSSIILPDSLLRWTCKLCQQCSMKPREMTVLQHISEMHGQFYLNQKSKWCQAVCRICLIEGFEEDILKHIDEHKLREDFAKDEEVKGTTSKHAEDEMEEGELKEEYLAKKGTSGGAVGSISIRADLMEKSSIKQEKKDRSPSIEVLMEKAPSSITVDKKNIKQEYSALSSPSPPNSPKPRKRDRQSSSSSSTSQTSREASRRNSSLSLSASRSRSGSRLNGKRSKLCSENNRTSSRPSSQDRRTQPRYPPPSRSRGRVGFRSYRPEFSPSREPYLLPSQARTVGLTTYYKYNEDHLSRDRPTLPSYHPRGSQFSRRSRSPQKYHHPESPQRYYQSKSPQRYHQQQSPKRYHQSKSPQRYYQSKSPQRYHRSPQRYHSKSPFRYHQSKSPLRYHQSKSPLRYHQSKSPPKEPSSTFHQQVRNESSFPLWNSRKSKLKSSVFDVRSPLRDSNRKSESPSIRLHSSGEENDYMIVGTGPGKKYKCQVCNTLSGTKLQHDQHRGASKHREALASARFVGTKNSVYYCGDCRRNTISEHSHCHLCDVHCNSPGQYKAHCQGKQHQDKIRQSPVTVSNREMEDMEVMEDRENMQDYPHQCPACQETFREVPQLRAHLKSHHEIMMTCTECESMGHNPAGQALFSQELIAHYSDVHNKSISSTDLRFFGRKAKGLQQMKSQGYVRCKLCPQPWSLGSPGLWFTNDPSMMQIKNHFKRNHPRSVQDYLGKISLCCQLCDDKLPGYRLSHWKALLLKHNREEEEEEVTARSDVPTVLCSYCGEKVPKEGQASQLHIKHQHSNLTFSCKLCLPKDRFYFQSHLEVLKHLKLKHYGVGNKSDANIIFPGSRSNLSAFSWVKCKTCQFRGIGGGEEVFNHLKAHPGSGAENLEIFCRLCHKDDTAAEIFEDFQEFEDHFRESHQQIMKYLS